MTRCRLKNRVFAKAARLLFTVACACVNNTFAETATILFVSQPAPEGNGVLRPGGDVGLNNAGQVVFSGSLTNTSAGTLDNTGIYLHNGLNIVNRVRANTLVPEGNGVFAAFQTPVLNDLGQIVFRANLSGTSGGSLDNLGNYLHTGTNLVNRGRTNNAVPEGNGTFSTVVNPGLGDSGHVAFQAFLRSTSSGSLNDTGIYVHNGAFLTNRAREGNAVPEGNGVFGELSFPSPAINAPGLLAFIAQVRNTTGGVLDDTGIYVHDGVILVNRVREGSAIPEGVGTFDNMSDIALNRLGQFAFRADLRGTGLGTLNDSGIYFNNGTNQRRVRENDAVPEGNGQFAQFGSLSNGPVINSSGQIAFSANLKNTPGSTLDDSGVYLHNGNTLVTIARKNQPAPDGNGNFAGFSIPALSGSGVVAIRVSLRNTVGGTTDNLGIYLSDGIDTAKVVRTGDTLAEKTVSGISGVSSSEGGRASTLNDFGQIAYQANFTDATSGIFLFTPELRWRIATSGNWDTSAGWSLGISPSAVHHTKIDPAASLTVFGPTSAVSVKSLQIGGGTGVATLSMRSGGSISSSTPVNVLPTGAITGDGSIIGTVNNDGVISADNLTITGGLVNSGVVTGQGRINAALTNTAGGEIRIGTGQLVELVGASNTSAGRIEVIDGELRFAQPISSTGNIVARNAVLRFDGGMNNGGLVGLSFGVSDIFGNITSSAGGRIVLSGASDATFYDDITLNAGSEFRVSTGSRAVYFGFVSGTGNFTGGGTKYFEGGSSASLGRLASGGITVISSGADVTADAIRESSLTIEGTAQLRPSPENSRVNMLSILPGGRLDLTSDTLIVDYSGASPISEIRALLQSGFAGGSWNGNGISSSTAAAQTNRAIGFAEATDIGSAATFAGEPIDATSLLMRFTLLGDANLDRIVNISDFSLLAANFNQNGIWSRGDFNYDGTINISDFAALAANFNQSLPTDLPRGSVPEPASALTLSAIICARRRLK